MLRKLQLILALCFMLTASSVVAQKIIRKADKQFELRAYDKAYDTYVEALAKYPEQNILKLQIAECLRRTNQVLQSKDWYETAINHKDVPAQYYLTYGHLLKSIGDYDSASIMYKKYAVVNPEVSEHFALSCDFAKNLMRDQSPFELLIQDNNSSKSDLAIAFHRDDMVMTSFRSDSEGKSAPRLYLLEGNNVKPLRSELKDQDGYGFISYATDKELCAFSRSNMKNNHEPVATKDEDHALYLAQVVAGGDFEDAVAFPYNESNSSSAFPCLTFDGSALYFASNRQGGFGGYDLYVSYYKGGEWTLPENLGASINTAGNEISPFFHNDELYFASDFHAGMGGYDIFRSEVTLGAWSYPFNLGNGINSPGDDYFPVLELATGKLIFSSNRLGGKGGDDIYTAIPTKQEPLYDIEEVYSSADKPSAIKLDKAYVPQFDGPNTNPNIQLVSAPETMSIIYHEPTTEPSTQASTEVMDIVGEDKAPKLGRMPLIDMAAINVIAPKALHINTKIAPAKYNEITEQEVLIATAKPAATKLITEVPGSRSINADVSLVGARRVAYGIMLPNASNAYFIQLASLSRTNGNVARFKSLIKYGNIYKVHKSNSMKIKLGYFVDRSEAQRVLRNVKAQGFKDAFITSDPLGSGEMELFVAGQEYDYNGNNYSQSVSTGSRFKVRLASYEDPIWFDLKKAKKLGNIEQWSKGAWTIFILSGFNNVEDAHAAKIRAINRGFVDAEVVIDNNGILERLKTN